MEMRLINANELGLDADWDDYEDGFTAYSKSQIESAQTVLTIPKNPTNGDMIKALFPKGKIIKFQTFIRYELSDGTCINVNDNWWNAPYKRGEQK